MLRQTPSVRLLLVEDETRLATAIARGLRAEGFDVDVAHTGPDGLWRAREGSYSAIVLDVLLPGLNGFALCRELRAGGIDTPVLLLTAKQGEHDEAEGLELGADDFLRKPFSFVVLVARLRALIRRATGAPDGVLAIGDLRVDPAKRRCWRGPSEIVLTARELDLLVALARRERRHGDEAGAAERGVGVRVRRRREHRRGVRRVPAVEDRSAVRPHRACRRSARSGIGWSTMQRDSAHRAIDRPGWWRRARGSVRLRVTVIAAGVFAVTLLIAAFALLRALEGALVDDVRAADRAALLAQARAVMIEGLPRTCCTIEGTSGSAVAPAVPGNAARRRVRAQSGRAGASPGRSSRRSTTSQLVPDEGARLLGIEGDAAEFTVSTLPVGGVVLATASPLDAVRDTLASTRQLLWVIGPALVALVAGAGVDPGRPRPAARPGGDVTGRRDHVALAARAGAGASVRRTRSPSWRAR